MDGACPRGDQLGWIAGPLSAISVDCGYHLRQIFSVNLQFRHQTVTPRPALAGGVHGLQTAAVGPKLLVLCADHAIAQVGRVVTVPTSGSKLQQRS